MKVIGLIQARMNSTRLPGKVMMPLANHPLIWHIMKRLKAVQQISDVCIATTKDERNNVLEKFSSENNIFCYRHHEEDDIIGRLHAISSIIDYDVMIKINSDCPLIDVKEIDKLLNLFVKKRLDFASNKISNTYPLGYSFEILTKTLIDKCDNLLKNKSERELVVNWIIDNKSSFKTDTISYMKNESHYKLTVDTKEDYLLVSKIFDELYVDNEFFGLEEVLGFLKDYQF